MGLFSPGSFLGGFIGGDKKMAEKEMAKARGWETQKYEEAKQLYQPYKDMGDTMRTDFQDFYNQGGYKFDPSKVQVDPGYAFREKQGMQGIENSAMARGGLMSGNTLKATQDYGQQLASQEYGNAYNRQYQDYQNQLGFRTNMLDWGLGQTDQWAKIQGLDPEGRHLMENAQQWGMKSKQKGAIMGSLLSGKPMEAAGGMFGGMF